MWDAATVMYLNKHDCRPCMHIEIIKLETTSSQKTSCQTQMCMCVCLTTSFLPIGGFVKSFHKIPWFFHEYSVFSNSMIFPCMEFFSWFLGFPDLVGILYYIHLSWHNTEIFNKRTPRSSPQEAKTSMNRAIKPALGKEKSCLVTRNLILFPANNKDAD